MTKEEHINYWLNSADHDLESSESLFHAGKYSWSLFIGHIVIEKGLKALFVSRSDNKIPPKIHNLVKLAEILEIPLNESQKMLLDEINDFNIEARYPEFKNEFYKTCTRDFAENYLQKIRELYQWLKSRIE